MAKVKILDFRTDNRFITCCILEGTLCFLMPSKGEEHRRMWPDEQKARHQLSG